MDSLSNPAECPACDHPAPRRDQYYYVWNEREYWLWRCGDCTHQFVFPFVDRAAQEEIYADPYFGEGGDWACGVFEGGYSEAAPSLRREAGLVLDMLPVNTGHLLDIGCAGGVFLDEARSRGFRVSGIEFNQSMAKLGQDRFGLDILNARIEDVPMGQWVSSIDVVTMLDCLEHIPRPIDVLRKVGAWVRPGGIVVIRGPLANSWASRAKEALRRFAKAPKRLPGYPLDANTFNPTSLTAMLSRAGFTGSRWVNLRPEFGNLIATRGAEPTQGTSGN